MTRRRKTWLVGIVLALVVVWAGLVVMRAVFSRVDYARALRGQEPLFAWEEGRASDGGTVWYRGIGYELMILCRYHVEDGWPIGYDRGPVLTYGLNWLLLAETDRQKIWFEPEDFAPAPPPASRPASE